MHSAYCRVFSWPASASIIPSSANINLHSADAHSAPFNRERGGWWRDGLVEPSSVNCSNDVMDVHARRDQPHPKWCRGWKSQDTDLVTLSRFVIQIVILTAFIRRLCDEFECVAIVEETVTSHHEKRRGTTGASCETTHAVRRRCEISLTEWMQQGLYLQ
jgi:hypothetical protein